MRRPLMQVSSHITFCYANSNLLWWMRRHYHMAGGIKMENGNLFIIKSIMRKCHSKSKCHSTGDLQMQHQKDKWKQSVSEPGRLYTTNHKHQQLSSSLSLQLHIVLSCRTPDTGTTSLPCIIFLLHSVSKCNTDINVIITIFHKLGRPIRI